MSLPADSAMSGPVNEPGGGPADELAKPDQRPASVQQARPAWWQRPKAWILAGVTAGLAALGSAAADWATEWVKASIGSGISADGLCAIGEWLDRQFGSRDPPDPARFTVLIARLDRDPDHLFTTRLLDAFRGAEGFRRRESCIAIAAGSDNDSEREAESTAERLRIRRGADLIVWGEVADPEDRAIRIWFSAANHRPAFGARPWRFERGTLEPAFGERFSVALQAVALSAFAAPLQQPSATVSKSIEALMPRLRALLRAPPVGMTEQGQLEFESAVAQGLSLHSTAIGSDEPLKEAVALYDGALARIAGKPATAAQARIKNDLGLVLLALGMFGHDDAPLRARTLLEEALQDLPADRSATERSAIRNNLGMALQQLGVRGDFGALKQASDIYEESLTGISMQTQPLLWLRTQNNRGVVLMTLGVRTSSIATLRRAQDAFEAVLDATGKAGIPDAENARSLAELNLAQVHSGIVSSVEDLRLALSYAEAASRSFTREAAPLLWAMAQGIQGSVLKVLGASTGDASMIDRAIDAYRRALSEYRRERTPLQWGYTQNNLALALALRDDDASLQEAAEGHRNALEELRRDVIPQDWAVTQVYLGRVLRRLGARGDRYALGDSVACFEAALSALPRERVPVPWATAKSELALSLKLLGDPESLRRSITAGQEALEVYESAGMSELAADATAGIEATRALLRAEERHRSVITAPADNPPPSENSGVVER